MGAAAASWRPTATPRARRRRARLLRALREFFHRADVLEVETPILSRAGNPDPQLAGFVTSDAAGDWYLRTSPEFALKRLLADDTAGLYELGRVFRRGEAGGRHNPEFTMLEWYRPGYDDRRLAQEVAALVQEVRSALGEPPAPARTTTCRELLRGVRDGFDPQAPDRGGLDRFLGRRGWSPVDLGRSDALELAIGLAAGEACAAEELLTVLDFPAELAALARIDGAVARRFEVFAGGVELANGYDELTDAAALGARLGAQAARRAELGRRPIPPDERLVAAHAAGLPACAGVSLGVDRLLAWIDGAERLADVIAFPAERA